MNTTNATSPFDLLHRAVQAHGCDPEPERGGKFRARCIWRHDEHKSFVYWPDANGRVVFFDEADPKGDKLVILEALGLSWAELNPGIKSHAEQRAPIRIKRRFDVPAELGVQGYRRISGYEYRDESGRLLFEVVRYECRDRRKAFRQQRPAGDDENGDYVSTIGSFNVPGGASLAPCRRVLYRLPELLAAPVTTLVFIVEGEKDVETLLRMGFAATTNPMGAGKWSEVADHAAEVLRDREVIVLPDADDAGRKHAVQVCRHLVGCGIRVRMLELPDLSNKGDVTDWFDLYGGTRERFDELVTATQEYVDDTLIDATGTRREVVNERPLDAIGSSVLVRLREVSGTSEALYRRGGELCRIVRDHEWRALIQVVGIAELRYIVARTVHTGRLTPSGQFVDVAPPRELLEYILAHPNPGFPNLAMLSEVPFVGPDGRVVSTEGYDEGTGVYVALLPHLRDLAVPESPSQADAALAVARLRRVFEEFPWQSPSDWANFLALLFTLLLRVMFPTVPAFMVAAKTQGTGKTLALRLASLIVLGREPVIADVPTEPTEFAKVVGAFLRSGQRFVVFDNAIRPIESATLAALLTSVEFTFRILGKSETMTLANTVVIAFTGNNPVVRSDLTRRTVWCDLDAKDPRPNLRRFAVSDIVAHVRENQCSLLTDVLSIYRAWFAAGRPEAPNVAAIGSFERWHRTVAGILHFAGVPSFLANFEERSEGADDEALSIGAFVRACYDRFAKTEWTANELCQRLADSPEFFATLPLDLQSRFDRGKGTLAWSIGRLLRQEQDRHNANGLVIRRLGVNRDKVQKYRVEPWQPNVESPRTPSRPSPEY
ncbi:MAG: toprim domain-containing protein [Phycisphaerae bacterium]|nr:toprim domain-containing protein [Phycisphaerae bacterium]